MEEVSPRNGYELVIVSYHSRPQIEGLLAGLPPDLPLVIIDNAAGRDGLAELVRARPNGRYLDGGGQGFAKAANLGARSTNHEFLIFVNPDCRPTVEDLEALAASVADAPSTATTSGTACAPTSGSRRRIASRIFVASATQRASSPAPGRICP